MNGNKKIAKKIVAGSMAVMMAAGLAGTYEYLSNAMQVQAAEQKDSKVADTAKNVKADNTSDSGVEKEESVYVKADANGNVKKTTVSAWLKNSGSVSGSLKDESTLKDVKNIKGDETFTENGDKLTWNTDGEDIYYQGTTDQELPVSAKLTYYLDGKEVKPDEIKGKSGHLKIEVQYTNNEKKTVNIDGKEEEVYTPFMMMTGMVLPTENFSNVVIDNGKVISDGDRSIVVGFGMPGLKESLDLDDDTEKDLTIPESLAIEADVTDFTMSSTFTFALSNLFDDMDLDDVVDIDSLQDSLDELEDAALELVSGSGTLADGAATLADGINSYTEGADELNAGIQKYLGSNGELNGSVTEYVNGVNKVVKGVQDYTEGTNALADGVSAYIAGEQQLSAGAAQLSQLSSGLEQVQKGVSALNAAVDGEVTTEKEQDLLAGAKELATGTATLKASLGSEEVQTLLGQVNDLLATGNELISETEGLSGNLQSGIALPVQNIVTNLESLKNQLDAINTQLTTLKSSCEQTINSANTKITEYNSKVEAAQTAAANSKNIISDSISSLQSQLDSTEDEAEKEQLQKSITALKNAQTAADGLSEVQKADTISVSFPSIDTSEIQKTENALLENLGTFTKTAEALNQQLPEMQEKLNKISSAKEQLPKEELNKLSTSVDELNTGMQSLYGGIQSLSGEVATLNAGVQEKFPTALTGISALNAGFTKLNANNKALLSGANQLKANSSTLVAGVGTLQSGTNQLANGLNTLGTQMSSGSAQLAANSDLLRSGASDLKDGAKELAEGMDKFDKEGTSKLKSTVEDELGDVIDRFKALTSDDCAYDTFSGKDSSMSGSVKFIIETEGIDD